MVVQGSSAVLIGEPFAQLPVGKHLSSEKGFEMKMAEAFPVHRIGTVVDASQAGKKTAAIGRGGCFGRHDSSTGQEDGIIGSITPSRQGSS
jgi:hypothetical protein